MAQAVITRFNCHAWKPNNKLSKSQLIPETICRYCGLVLHIRIMKYALSATNILLLWSPQFPLSPLSPVVSTVSSGLYCLHSLQWSLLSPVVSTVSSGLCCLQWSPQSPVVSIVFSGLHCLHLCPQKSTL